MSARRAAKGQHAAATPRIINLNLARRSGAGGRPGRGAGRAQHRPAPPPVNLGALFEMERRVRGLESAPASPPPPCSRAPARSQEDDGEQEEKWRFQAEILRAECNFLRMEREVALRKLDRHRGQMEAALKSAVETLVSVMQNTNLSSQSINRRPQSLCICTLHLHRSDDARMSGRNGRGGRRSTERATWAWRRRWTRGSRTWRR